MDVRLGGGIPIPNLLLIEGEHGSGKTALLQQIVYGATSGGFKVAFFTLESTIKELLFQSRKISLDLTPAYLRGLLEIFQVHSEKVRWSKSRGRMVTKIILDFISGEGREFDVYIVDNVTAPFTYNSKEEIVDFLSKLRIHLEEGKLAILTLHPKILSEDLEVIVKSMCDSYLKLGLTPFGGSLVKIMQVVKFRGSENPVETTIAFDVDPAFGIKILPIALAKA